MLPEAGGAELAAGGGAITVRARGGLRDLAGVNAMVGQMETRERATELERRLVRPCDLIVNSPSRE